MTSLPGKTHRRVRYVHLRVPEWYEAKVESFPWRNRLISGLSLGTLMVEAAKRSGSLMSTCFVAKRGREILPFPASL
jgi:DNA processing protein